MEHNQNRPGKHPGGLMARLGQRIEGMMGAFTGKTKKRQNRNNNQ